MKSCLGILIVFATLITVVGGGALVWYLSENSEFTRTAPATSSTTPAPVPPRAQPAPAPRQNRTAPMAPPARPAPIPAPQSAPGSSTPFGEKR